MMSRALAHSHSAIWDLCFATVGICAGIVGLTYVNQPDLWNRWLEEPSRTTVADLIPVSGSIRLKKDSFAFWQDVQNPSVRHPVADGDTVFTGPEGHAVLKLQDGTTAQLQPSSLIVIHAPPAPEHLAEFVHREPSAIEVRKGSVGLKLATPRSAVRLLSRGKEYRIEAAGKPAEVRLEAQGGEQGGTGVQIIAEKGSALRVKGSEPQALVVHAGQTAEVDSKADQVKLVPVVLEPHEPRSGESRIIAPGAPVGFSWAPVDPARVSEFKLELRGMRSQEISADPKSGGLALALPPGKYEWRILAQSTQSNGVHSAWRPFELIALSPPQARAPLDGASFTSRTARVEFRWSTGFSATQAEFELTRPSDPEWKMTQKVRGHGTELALSQGSYQWRVRSWAGSQASPWSAPRSLHVGPEAPKHVAALPPAPVHSAPVSTPPAPSHALSIKRPQLRRTQRIAKRIPKHPPARRPAQVMKPAVQVPRLGQPAAGGFLPTERDVVVTWATLPMAEKYEFELASDPGFGHVVAHSISKANWWMGRKRGREGTHYWRVRALKAGKPGPWSPARRLLIQ